MKVPYKWLKDYVAIDAPVDEFVDAMVMTGNGVEEVADLGANMEKVVVGRIEKLEKHPDADKLQICQIDVGEAELLQIVTGADNVFEGALVPVALCGSKLPSGVKIKKGKLRGVDSFGMLCSGEELCLKEADYPGAGVYGILILREGMPGQDMREVLMLNDTVIDFEVGANRPDCLSVLGIAREASAAMRAPLSIPDAQFRENGESIADYVRVDVQAPDLCPRYMARAIKNVKIGPSPRWMQEKLKAAGVRPISNIVDITNFVMIETGQPMHAFDAKDIRGSHIVVRRAEQGERIVTLDGKERALASSMLLICDEQGPIGIAGVMGGENSEIKEDTKTVIFESAKFGYGNIRQTSRALGLATEASTRYSKGVDAGTSEYALHRACQLVEQLEAGEVVGGEIDLLAEDLSEKKIVVRAAEINALLGTQLSAVEMKECLDRVLIETELDGATLACRIPHYRGDIDGKADIAEEVARIYGYDNIPENAVSASLTGVKGMLDEAATDLLKHYAVGAGFYECVTYSFAGEADFDKLCLPADSPLRRAVRIKNPLGDDSAYMRTTLAADMLKVMALNLKRKNKKVRLFEIDKVYLPESLPLAGALPDERKTMILAISQDVGDFYTLKEVVENICEVLRVPGLEIAVGGPEYYHPGRKAVLSIGGREIGKIGEIHPDVQKNFGIPCRTCVAELDLRGLIAEARTQIKFAPLPKYPAIERDIALVVDRAAQSGSIRGCILKNGGKYIENAELFDVYEGAQLGDEKKSLAYSLTFRSNEGTLTDEMIAADMERILQALKEEFGASLRE